jgi:hypothetical protein
LCSPNPYPDGEIDRGERRCLLPAPGWEILISRIATQRRSSDGKVRTVGTYQAFHDADLAQDNVQVG